MASADAIRAADGLRRLGHALIGKSLPEDLLGSIAEQSEGWLAEADSAPDRRRARHGYLHDLAQPVPEQGDRIDHFPECPVSGPANPFSLDLHARRDGAGVVVRTRLGPAHEGAPGRAHGGVLAAIFDDVMGFVTIALRAPAYQGELTVRYVAPTPIGPELVIRAWPVTQTDRALVVEASLSSDGVELVRARGHHVLVAPERLVPLD